MLSKSSKSIQASFAREPGAIRRFALILRGGFQLIQALRVEVLLLGVVIATGLYFWCLKGSDAQSQERLNDAHEIADKLLIRDIDDLNRQITQAIQKSREGLPADTAPPGLPQPKLTEKNAILGFASTPEGFFIKHPLAPKQKIQIQNAQSSPFRGSLRFGSSVHLALFDLDNHLIDQNQVSLGSGKRIQKSSEIRGSNLRLVSQLSLNEQRAWIQKSVLGFALCWVFFWLVAVYSRWRRRKQRKYMLSWLTEALSDFRFGRICKDFDQSKAGSSNAEVLKPFSDEFQRGTPYLSGFSICVLDQHMRLGTWSYFRAKLESMLSKIGESEQVAVGMMKVMEEAAAPNVLSHFSNALGNEGELVQCFYLEDTLLFAFKTRKNIRASACLLEAFRKLMKANVIKAAKFFSKTLVVDFRADCDGIDYLLNRLNLTKDGKSYFRDSESISVQTHIVMQEGVGFSEVSEFNWIQAIFLESYLSSHFSSGSSQPIHRPAQLEINTPGVRALQ